MKLRDELLRNSSAFFIGLLLLTLFNSFIPYTDSTISGHTSYSPTVENPYNKINGSRIVSNLPLPDGYELVSAQAAPYYDASKGVLHVWYGLKIAGQGEEENEILYTNTTDFITWADPVVVIDLPNDGIRDPTIFIEGDYIYLFCQCYNATTKKYHPIRLYKISKSAEFWDPSKYIYVGDVVDLGNPGSFDDTWVASFCLVKINGVYYGAYEAKDSNGVFSIGRVKTMDIESVPYDKDGQLRDPAGEVIYNPVDPHSAIVPDTFADYNVLYIHYDNDSGIGEDWQARYLTGDFSKNAMALSTGDLRPQDPYHCHNNIAHIGQINGRYTFLMQSGNLDSKDTRLRLYMEPAPPLSGKGELTTYYLPAAWTYWLLIILPYRSSHGVNRQDPC